MASKPVLPPLLSEKERTEAHKRAKRRAAKQFEEREHLRLEIKGRMHLNRVQDILSEEWPRDSHEIAIRRHKMEYSMKLLAKLIPDLKSMEHKVEDALQEHDGVVMLVSPVTGEPLGVIQREDGNKPVSLPMASSDPHADPDKPEYLQ